MRHLVAHIFERWCEYYGLVHRKNIPFNSNHPHEAVLLEKMNSGDCGVTAFAVGAVLKTLHGLTPTFCDNGEHAYFFLNVSGMYLYFDAYNPAGTDCIEEIRGCNPNDLSNVTSGDFKWLQETFMPSDSLGWEYIRVFYGLMTNRDFDTDYPYHRAAIQFDYYDVYVHK